MRTRLLAAAPLALVAGLLAASVLPGAVNAQERQLSAQLSGAAEVPGPGDPAGAGAATVTLNADQGTVCYVINVVDIAPASGAHIHRGAADASGPIVVPFDAPTTGNAIGCTEGVDGALITEIMQSPGSFYVNIHNADFPAGAIRGQLQ